ncbi:hypothetical protein P9X10_00720 [Bacillus cereus]|nr:hypothetical protein [Bacillus cereus]
MSKETVIKAFTDYANRLDDFNVLDKDQFVEELFKCRDKNYRLTSLSPLETIDGKLKDMEFHEENGLIVIDVDVEEVLEETKLSIHSNTKTIVSDIKESSVYMHKDQIKSVVVEYRNNDKFFLIIEGYRILTLHFHY